MEFKSTKKKIDISDIRKLENKYHFKFDKYFEQHYLIHNGGIPKNTVLPGNNNNYIIDEFLSIKYGRDNEYSETLDLIGDVLPQNVTPFAIDPFGNYFCFNKKGEILFWDHEEAEDDGNKAVKKIANNLRELLERLTDK